MAPKPPPQLPPIDREKLIRELVARGGLHEFIRIFWSAAEPRAFVDNWHVGALCEYLEAVTAGQIKRLVINIPPGCMKSLTCSVFWPAYMWALDPTTSMLVASFDPTLASTRDGQKMIDVITSPDYAAAYPAVKLRAKKPALGHFENTAGGFRFATSPEGKGTGRHVDGILIDDPMKPQDAIMQRKSAFDKVNTWFSGTLQSRFRRWLVLIMQRLHTDDLAQYCLNKGYDSLILQMYRTKKVTWARDPRKEGELLFPALHPAEKVREMELELKNEASAQLQQDPTPATGGIIEEPWTRLEWIDVPKKGTFVQSWDFSGGGTTTAHSKVSGQLWCGSRDVKYLRELLCSLDDRLAKLPGAFDSRVVTVPERAELYLLIDRVTGHWNFPRQKTEFLAAQRRPHWSRARVKLLERKANGQAIIDELKRQVAGIVSIDPDGPKEERLRVHADKFETSLVVFPPGPVGDEVREQLIKFPRFTWDDDVDTTTQALDRLASKSERYRENLRKIAGRR